MSRLEEMKAFGNGLPVASSDKGVSIGDVIDFIVEHIRKSADMRTSAVRAESLSHEAIGERVIEMQVRRADGSTMSIGWRGGRLGHGPLSDWLPHKCHKTVVLCWPEDPEDPGGDEICMTLQLPWPCNPRWPFPGQD